MSVNNLAETLATASITDLNQSADSPSSPPAPAPVPAQGIKKGFLLGGKTKKTKKTKKKKKKIEICKCCDRELNEENPLCDSIDCDRCDYMLCEHCEARSIDGCMVCSNCYVPGEEYESDREFTYGCQCNGHDHEGDYCWDDGMHCEECDQTICRECSFECTECGTKGCKDCCFDCMEECDDCYNQICKKCGIYCDGCEHVKCTSRDHDVCDYVFPLAKAKTSWERGVYVDTRDFIDRECFSNCTECREKFAYIGYDHFKKWRRWDRIAIRYLLIKVKHRFNVVHELIPTEAPADRGGTTKCELNGELALFIIGSDDIWRVIAEFL